MPASLSKRIRRFLRGHWKWVQDGEGPAEIPIGTLVSPLRYDVLTRKAFIEFYEANRDLYRSDLERFVDLARLQPYAVWLEKIVTARHKPHLLADPAALRRSTGNRVQQFITLYDHMLAVGFDRRHPIEIRVTDRLLPTATGKHVQAPYVLGDGSHRLAFLMTQGYDALPREYFRIRWFRQIVPFDSTATLVREIPLVEAEYAAYLSLAYAAPATFTRLDNLQAHVAASTPARLEELRTLIGIDGFGTLVTR
jgi:hypothetical protein